ncbi:MAG: aminopeptidase [Candidatus Woesearchaeota archaeon]
MDSVKFVEWLKRENLFDTVNNNYNHFINVLKKSLNVSREQVLLVGDLGYPTRRLPALMLGGYLLAAKRMGLNYKLVIQDPIQRGGEASDQVVESLLNLPNYGVIIFSLSGKPGSLGIIGSSYRKFARSHGHRFVSSTGLGDIKTSNFKDIVNSINVDFDKMRARAEQIKKAMDMGSEIKVITDSGTNLTFDIKLKSAISNDANYINPGTGGNIPAGEVYIPPRKIGINGTAIIDGCSRNLHGTLLAKTPIKMRIEDGVVTSINGGEEAKALEDSLKWAEEHARYPWGIRRIGELGIGINPGARIVDSTLISEKTLGSAHIALGSNYWFGGTVYAIIHLDQVFRNPKIWIDGERLEIK